MVKTPKASPAQQSLAPSSEAQQPVDDTPPPDFPIVGIGCSAGGLEALEKFLTNVPAGCGFAFVIVQHLDPTHLSALPDLLQRFTPMPVTEITDGLRLKPDSVYVIPPNKDLSLLHGKLHLLEPVATRGLRLPIDFFLRALAEDLKEKAIGVILSGMGSDGVFGLRAIKEKTGLTVAQDPTSAKADSMPYSAIQAGVVDIVAPPEALPGRIAEYLQHPAHAQLFEISPRMAILTALDKIVILLRDRCGNDFSLYKTNTLNRRIERRMAVNQIAGIDDYVRYLRDNEHELDILFKELLIGVTNFFRDAEAWEYLRNEAIPALLAQHPEGKSLRAWVAACSTGEEAYSLAIVLKEAIEEARPERRFTLQIYATDLDTDAIEQARKGFYPDNIAADVSAERLARHFTHEESGGYRINKDIREMVVFAPQNIISDPPFTKLDILTCRNLLIYFGAQLQRKLLPLFYYALNPGGMLFLGSAESIGNAATLFAPLTKKGRLFQRLNQPLPLTALEFPRKLPSETSDVSRPAQSERPDNLGQLTDQLIQQTWAPAAVVVNGDGDILYFSGRTGKYLEPAAGKTNINIHAMAREGLREALTGVIRNALNNPLPILINGLRVGTNGGTQIVDLVVQALDKPEPLRGRVIIVFKDVRTPLPRRKSGKHVEEEPNSTLMRELRQAREALQVTHEEMQTSVEELKSSNEELQSTNEELQSTNEELTTSKEELQSLNEELQTVNAELQSKLDELTWIRNDMTNLLNSTEIATVFLDNEMNLRRFSTHATKLFKLISSDVGRPLSHIVTDLDYPKLKDDALEVLNTLIFHEKVTATHDGRWYRVRIMPYRTQDNVIDGVVITFIDITEIKLLEAKLRTQGA
ncbi:chemotaxis protein CheB [Dechloromonas denitrificans]|uniref:chemotaxis protein CheB n=1 Tax=Dechloromonas denitrificans TaxID=281362 RepID=UPI001CFC1E99|nr:chemotaxis protein CheB [Dechloromonas denitrificans]UCV09488.1 PAS domain-containing protein [Dechloromonas denitrificans]